MASNDEVDVTVDTAAARLDCDAPLCSSDGAGLIVTSGTGSWKLWEFALLLLLLLLLEMAVIDIDSIASTFLAMPFDF